VQLYYINDGDKHQPDQMTYPWGANPMFDNRRSPWDKGMLHNVRSLEKLHITCMWVSEDVRVVATVVNHHDC